MQCTGSEPRPPRVEQTVSSLHPALPYIVPFATLLFWLAIQNGLGVLGAWEAPLRFVVLAAVLLLFSRPVLDLRVVSPWGSVTLGLAVFAVWILPDTLWPAYRGHWLFQHPVLGSTANAANARHGADALFVTFRFLRAALIVPLAEELFWRGWLARWLVRTDFRTVALGEFTRASFVIASLLFAAEHGPYWDVGLCAGIAYNWWMLRTRRLGDCILAHAVTNAALSLHVLVSGQWQYWP